MRCVGKVKFPASIERTLHGLKTRATSWRASLHSQLQQRRLAHSLAGPGWVPRELDLRAKEFDLLAFFTAEAGSAVPRERIMCEVWDEHWYGPRKVLDVRRIRALGWSPRHTLREGLADVYRWAAENHVFDAHGSRNTAATP